jgi:dimethylglycine dehydrogenase
MGELTITRLESNRYYVVAAAGVAVHHLDWLQRYQPDDGSVHISDLTGRYGVLSVMGPRSRALMERVSDADYGARSFRFLDAREVSIGMATALALRVSFVGELGWEIHHRIEFQRYIYDRLLDAGGELGIVDFGYRALNAMGLEKSYPVWGEDLSPAHSPLEAGLDRFVDPAKGPFIGRDAFLRDRNSPVERRLVSLAIDDGLALPRGGEPVIEDGRVLGHLAAAGYGYTVGRPIGRAYLPIEKASVGCSYEVQVLQETRKAIVVDTPYDAEGCRLRG